jgi:hypothetical protein
MNNLFLLNEVLKTENSCCWRDKNLNKVAGFVPWEGLTGAEKGIFLRDREIYDSFCNWANTAIKVMERKEHRGVANE